MSVQRSTGGALAGRLLELLLPPACAGCGGVVSRRGRPPPRVCVQCRTRLRPPAHPRCTRCDAPRGTGLPSERTCPHCQDWPPILDLARAAVVLAPPADRLVYALKYGGWPELGSELAEHMSRVLRLDATFGNETEPEQSRPIVPVPTTPGRLRTRGYNQARVLAEEVAGQMGAPLLDVLVRDEGGDSQIGLLPGERRANVDDAFSLRDRADVQIQDREVILVDDVLTTGATASASAVALESAGARRVRLLTFARSLPEPE